MADVDDWNAQVIAEFQANEGRVGGQFEGAPVVLMDRCRNMTSAGRATVEVGAETYPVAVSEITGEDRDRIYAEQAARYPGFAEDETSTAGICTIPVLALTRAS